MQFRKPYHILIIPLSFQSSDFHCGVRREHLHHLKNSKDLQKKSLYQIANVKGIEKTNVHHLAIECKLNYDTLG